MMSTSATITKQVIVPEQPLSPVGNARETARALGGTLAAFDEAVGDVSALAKAKEGRYLLAVDSKGLPKEEGRYLIIRKNGKVTFRSIKEKKADKIILEGRYNEVLYNNESALKAAKEGRPVALDVDWGRSGGWYLDAVGWPDDVARVALSNETLPRQSRVNKSLLRSKPTEAKP